MRMTLKKLLVVMSAISLTMVGCSKDESSSSSSVSSSSEQSSSEVVSSEAPVTAATVKLGIWPQDTLTDEIKLHEGYVKAFNEKYPNVTIQPAFYKYATDTFVALAESQNLPTIFETWYTEPQKLISANFIKDITAELEKKGWANSMNPAIKTLLSKDGKIYGIPRDGYALGMMLNVELFAEAGLVDANGLPLYPKTWDELAKAAVTIKEKTGSAGIVLLAKDGAAGWHFSNIAWNFGAELEKEVDGKWMAQLNSEPVVNAMQYVKDLKWKYDVLTADPLNEDWGTGFKALGTGTAAMYIGANDAVNQATYVNKLPVDKLALVPMPKGPTGAQYALMGGTPYVFANNATSEQVTGALDYLEIMGKAPVATEAVIAGLKADAKYRVENGIPVIPSFPAWTDSAYLAAQDAVVKEFSNVDMRLYQEYYDMVSAGTQLKLEEPKETQDMYAELTKVIQEVVTNKDANVKGLLDTAQSNFQKILDTKVNK